MNGSLIRYPFLLVLLFNTLVGTPQSPGVGRFFDDLEKAKADTDRAKIYYSLSRYYWNTNADSTLLMGKKSLDIATSAHYEKGIALAYLTMGVGYGTKGMYPEALDCDLKALRLSEKLGLEGLSGNNYCNIAIVYSNMGDLPRALDYFRRSLQITRQFSDQHGLAQAFINMGDIFTRETQLDSALAYTSEALFISEKLHDSLSLSISLSNIGDIYVKRSDPLTALDYFKRSLQISEAIHDADGISYTSNSMANAYHQHGQYKESIHYALASLKEARELNAKETIKNSYHALYSNYQDLGDFREALAWRNREIALADSLYNLDKEKQIKTLQSDYELEKKQHQVDLLTKDKLLEHEELRQSRLLYYFSIAGAILLIIWATILTGSNVQKRRINQLLEARNLEIVKQNQQLADLNAVKNKLLSIISHDLRSPIITLKGFVDLIKGNLLSLEQVRHFGAQVDESLTSTSTLLDNLLFWAKTQMEGLKANAKSFDLLPVLEQNRRLASIKADKKKITILIEKTDDPVLTYADEVMVDIVIRNLVDNAIKFCREGDSIHLSATCTPANVSVTIRDTGKGIAIEDQDKIFTSISYTTTGTSYERGSGLGLSLCKELIEKNNGKIAFESTPGKGTSFTFTLPIIAYI